MADMTVTQDGAVQAVHAVLVELSETQTRLLARHALLSTILEITRTPRPHRRRVGPGAIRVPSQPSEGHG